MQFRLRSLGAAFGFSLALGACEDPLRLKAQFRTTTDTLVAYALTGTPVSHPNAIVTRNAQLVRADGSFLFDLAFELDAAGRVLLAPVRLVAGTLNESRRVGLLHSDSAFAALLRAPNEGYRYDSLFVAEPGETVVIQARPVSCIQELSPYIYSKLVVDSVDVARRSIFFRFTADPNCGFRSFADGIPAN